jgi:excisionase family DNA binding protein
MIHIKRMREEYIATERLLSIDDVARIVTRARSHVVKLLDTGQLPFIPCGAHRRIRPADLEDFLKKQKRTTAEATDPKLYHRHGRRSPVVTRRPPNSCINDADVQALFK